MQVCPTCQARFIDGQLYWSTGKPGDPKDLAGLVCNPFSNGRPCINPCKGVKGGQTWEDRLGDLNTAIEERMLPMLNP